MSTPTINTGDALRFLDVLFQGKPDAAYIHVWTLKYDAGKEIKKSYFDTATQSIVGRLGGIFKRNIWVGCGTRYEDMGDYKRGGVKDISGIPGVWADIDIKSGEAHKGDGCFPDLATAIECLKAVNLKPTIIIDSGHGLQAYWLFDRFMAFSNNEQRLRASSLLKQWTQYLQTVAYNMGGFSIDSANDLPRILRLPGTINTKPNCDPVEVKIISLDGPRYSDEHIESICTKFLEQNSQEPQSDQYKPIAPYDDPRHWLDVYTQQATPGNRNTSLVHLACMLRDNCIPFGTSIQDAEALLSDFANNTERSNSELAGACGILKEPPRKPCGLPNKSRNNKTLSRPSEKDLESARASIVAAKEAGTASAVYAIIDQLAMLSPGECNDVFADLKKAIPALDCRDLKTAVSKAKKRALNKVEAGNFPRLVVNNRQLRDMGDDALRIIESANLPPVVFVRSGELIRLSIDENNSARVQSLSESHVTARLAKLCNIVVRTEDGDKNATPPRCIAEYIMAQPNYNFPALSAITNTPPVRPDGSVSSAPGYDPQTKLYYHQKTACDLGNIPDNPSKTDIARAKDLLEEIICDFPFDSQASKTNAIALLMTPVLRATFDGQPLAALIDAPKQKSGKGLLSQVTAIIATGSEVAVTPAPEKDEEWSKVITAKLLDGPTLLVFDNIKHVLGGASIEAALTAASWENRILGTSRKVELPNLATWIFNGNNIRTTDDIATRIISIRIDPKCSDPENRKDFKHPRLKQWVKENRGAIIAAIVTLFRAWVCAGRPSSPNVPVVGAYEEYSYTLGNVLDFAGIKGFLSNAKDIKNKLSAESPQWEAFLTEWREIFGNKGITTKEFIATLDDIQNDAFSNTIPSDLAEAIDKAPKATGRNVNIGRVFTKRDQTRFGDDGLYLYKSDTLRARAVVWHVGDKTLDTKSESMSLNESLQPNAHANDLLYKRDNKSHDMVVAEINSNRLTDSLTIVKAIELMHKSIGPYECAACKNTVALVETNKPGMAGEYSCECGHKGIVDNSTYDKWLSSHKAEVF